MSASSPVSSLSSPPVSEAGGDTDHDLDASSVAAGPPTKKRRVARPPGSPPHSPTIKIGTAPDAFPPLSPLSDVSSDDDVYLPGDANWPDEIQVGSEQVRRCMWGSCQAGDLGDQDELVKHVHDVHIPESKATKYMCEWTDCKARSKPQGSAYALRAHLRSHTKEKPFYCALPECDRAFTRSDALAKHMRTVHENENIKIEQPPGTSTNARRTAGETAFLDSPTGESTPLSGNFAGTGDTKGHGLSGTKAPKSIKLHFGAAKSSNASTPVQDDESLDVPLSPVSPSERDEVFGPFPKELDFEPEELEMSRKDLYRLLKRQLHWAEQEGKELSAAVAQATKQRQQEWMSKELVMENVMEAEFAQGIQRRMLNRSALLGPEASESKIERRPEGSRVAREAHKHIEQALKLPVAGAKQPWYRDQAWLDELDAIDSQGSSEGDDVIDLTDVPLLRAAGEGFEGTPMDIDGTDDEA